MPLCPFEDIVFWMILVMCMMFDDGLAGFNPPRKTCSISRLNFPLWRSELGDGDPESSLRWVSEHFSGIREITIMAISFAKIATKLSWERWWKWRPRGWRRQIRQQKRRWSGRRSSKQSCVVEAVAAIVKYPADSTAVLTATRLAVIGETIENSSWGSGGGDDWIEAAGSVVEGRFDSECHVIEGLSHGRRVNSWI